MVSPAPADCRPGRRAGLSARRGEQGYNLVVLVMAITILNIVLAATLPLWSQAIRRDKEEEAIFRGLQYAEAIRVYKNRHNGQPPVRLEQLMEKPRCIRQLWKDPLAEDGKWVIDYVGQPPNPVNPQGKSNEGEVVAVGPIAGVHSRSARESILIFNGRQQYNQWLFTPELLTGAAAPPNPQGVGSPPQRVQVIPTRWIGRPLPPSLSLPTGNLPDGTPVFGTPGAPGIGSPGAPGIGTPRKRPPTDGSGRP